MYEPPPGFDDMLGDAELVPMEGPFRTLEVPGVGSVLARRPMPRSTAALAMSANAKIDATARQDYLTLFVRNHLADGEYERLMVAMINGEAPPDTLGRVARSISTWGTARPMLPSSASR